MTQIRHHCRNWHKCKWEFSKSKSWIYEYKLHISTGNLIILPSYVITTASIADNPICELLASLLTNKIKNITANFVYVDGELYQHNKENHLRLIYLIEIWFYVTRWIKDNQIQMRYKRSAITEKYPLGNSLRPSKTCLVLERCLQGDLKM